MEKTQTPFWEEDEYIYFDCCNRQFPIGEVEQDKETANWVCPKCGNKEEAEQLRGHRRLQ